MTNMNADLKSVPAPLALVLGVTGGIGSAVAVKLAACGYRVRAMNRNPGALATRLPAYEWVAGDAMRREDVIAAARGASLIVHAVNPPGYRDWGKLVLPMIDNTIAAAQATGARILMPGTVYNFGPDAFPLLHEESPQKPLTSKGRIRVALEQKLEAAARRGTRVLIVRAGDFFGPGAVNNWFGQVVVKPGRAIGRITNPAAKGIGHQWAYLPDVSEIMVRLIERWDELPAFARFHMDGFFDHDGRQLADAIRRVTGRPELKASTFRWAMVVLASPFVRLFRELAEMRYLWKQTIRLDNEKLVAFLGEEPHTPIDEAVAATLASLGCLPEGKQGSAPVGRALAA